MRLSAGDAVRKCNSGAAETDLRAKGGGQWECLNCGSKGTLKQLSEVECSDKGAKRRAAALTGQEALTSCAYCKLNGRLCLLHRPKD